MSDCSCCQSCHCACGPGSRGQDEERTVLGLEDTQRMLVIFDVFCAHRVESVKTLFATNNIDCITIPANCTSKLQPMDLTVNKPFKDAMKHQFTGWYSDQVNGQLQQGTAVAYVCVDLRLLVVKPLNAKWIIKAVESISENPEIVISGFKRAGIA